MNIKHLGLTIREKASNTISKELYLSAKPEGYPGWEEHHLIAQIPKARLNYDLNMRFFASLNENDFNKHLSKLCKKFKIKECLDLNQLNGVTGIYIMVLDQYKQFYIGKANDIKSRIRAHWNNSKSLERLIFGDVCTSILSIDSFGALDTTRVFYRECYDPLDLEERIVATVDSQYSLNRTAGGIGSSSSCTETTEMAQLAIVAGRRKRDMLSFVSLEELREAVSEKELTFYQARYPFLFQTQ